MKYKTMDLVVVRWVDSCGAGGETWSRIGESVAKLRSGVAEENVSVGWIIYGDDKCLIIASHLSSTTPEEGDQFGGEMAFPREAIRSVRKVRG